jgi:hypothetical protein
MYFLVFNVFLCVLKRKMFVSGFDLHYEHIDEDEYKRLLNFISHMIFVVFFTPPTLWYRIVKSSGRATTDTYSTYVARGAIKPFRLQKSAALQGDSSRQ